MSIKEIRIAGFGGQGVILSGQILGQAASIYDDGFATLTQSYGPEARGGACAAEVVISDEPVGYPFVHSPQVQILLSQQAYTKYNQNSTPGVMTIIDPDLVKPDPSRKPEPLSIPATAMARDMGRPVAANIIMLGFLAAVSELVSAESLKKSIMTSVPRGTEEFNARAFELGYEYGLKHGKRTEG